MQQFATAKKEAAASAMNSESVSCFDTELANAGLSFEGICDTDKACFFDRYAAISIRVDTLDMCGDACVGMVTPAEEEAIHQKCEKKAHDKVRNLLS